MPLPLSLAVTLAACTATHRAGNPGTDTAWQPSGGRVTHGP